MFGRRSPRVEDGPDHARPAPVIPRHTESLMQVRHVSFALAFVTTIPAATAAGQERGQVGLTMGYPGSIGIIWHISDAVAVRPELSVSRTSVETTSVTTLTTFPGSVTTTSQSTTTSSWT